MNCGNCCPSEFPHIPQFLLVEGTSKRRGSNAKRQVPKRIALYVRTSTANGQTTANGQATKNQDRELQAVAERHGWEVVTVYRDQGISGANGRDKRLGLDEEAVARKEVDIIATWSVDRLGRSLTDLVLVLQDLQQTARRDPPFALILAFT